MEKYINADHQNLAVWCRRADIELVEPEKRLAVLGMHFGTGRRAVLRMIGVRMAKNQKSDLEVKVGWLVGHAIGDLVYTMAYTDEVIKNQHTWLGQYVAKHCKEDAGLMASVLLNAEFICKEASKMFAARQAEYNKRTNGQSLAGMIIRKARGH